MNQLRALWPYVVRYRWRYLLGILCNTIQIGFTVMVPQVVRDVVNEINTKGIVLDDLVASALKMLGMAAVVFLFGFLSRVLILGTAHQVEGDVREAMFRRLLILDQKFYGEHHTGDLMTRVTNDISAIRQFFGPGVQQIGAVLMIVSASALMVATNLTLALIVLALLPVVTILFIVVGARMRLIFRKVQDLFGEVSTRVQEDFSGIRTIKAYTQEAQETEEFLRVNERYRAQNVRYVLLSGLLWPIISLVMGIIGSLVLLIGGQQVAAGKMTIGDLVLFNSYLAALGWPVVALGWTVDLYQQAVSAAGRLGEVLQRIPSIRNNDDNGGIEHAVTGAIRFHNVGVSVGSGADVRWILRHISFEVAEGQTVAIVGATGGGKTTLVNLLARVQDPSEGTISVDGHDIRDITLSSLREGIGYVPQDTFLFSVPVRENVAFGRPDASAEEIERALHISRLSNDIVQLPSGIDTLVGERGVTLSGGQKQRTAIARAVLRNPAILVLDDALSSVDTHTASQILEGLRQFRHGRTAILIAQRIATVRDADLIVLLRDGEIAEQGSHASLLAQGGLYTAMYQRETLADAVDNA
jgi:ATP-binding cassette, subfamily B, multidrug efflux pump